ncbi:MAG TPA: hypothetical protein VF666_13060 [Pyrinomonadaceae bacterium]
MAGILTTVLNLFAHPKRVIQIDESKLKYLDAKTAHILFALGEAVIGEDFRDRVPEFIPNTDDILAYQRREQRETLKQGLLLLENPIANKIFGASLRGFSHHSLKERQEVLKYLKESKQDMLRNLYGASINIAASAYYASEATWKDILYDGVSVDHPELLKQPLWRPGDPRPVEK